MIDCKLNVWTEIGARYPGDLHVYSYLQHTWVVSVQVQMYQNHFSLSSPLGDQHSHMTLQMTLNNLIHLENRIKCWNNSIHIDHQEKSVIFLIYNGGNVEVIKTTTSWNWSSVIMIFHDIQLTLKIVFYETLKGCFQLPSFLKQQYSIKEYFINWDKSTPCPGTVVLNVIKRNGEISQWENCLFCHKA